jgi:hypothetical protein
MATENTMREIDYSNYFWQDDEVRLRAIQPEDWEGDYISKFDTPSRRFLEWLMSYHLQLKGQEAVVSLRWDIRKYIHITNEGGLK